MCSSVVRSHVEQRCAAVQCMGARDTELDCAPQTSHWSDGGSQGRGGDGYTTCIVPDAHTAVSGAGLSRPCGSQPTPGAALAHAVSPSSTRARILRDERVKRSVGGLRE